MATLREVCRYVRSKNAGPFWVTLDLFFNNDEAFARFGASEALSTPNIARLFGVAPEQVKRFVVPSLNVVKLSYPRQRPQGWSGERDMHSGQQYVRLLDLGLG